MAKKKAARKKSLAHRPLPPGLQVKPKVLRITLESDSMPASANASAVRSDQISWYNGTDRGRTVVFMPMDPAEVKSDWWPFVEAPEFITIAPHQWSRIYTVCSEKVGSEPQRQFFYRVDPPLEEEASGPGDPVVIVDY